MYRFGRWRAARGRRTSYLATYWGGALFAFAVALVRYARVHA